MIIQINFDLRKEYILCSVEVGRVIEELANEFDNWIHDRSIDHKYWRYHNGEKFGVCYKGDAFVDWLNNYRFKDNMKKAELVAESSEVISQVEKIIYF